MEQRYTVTQAAEMLGIKAYVLRYWEEELELHIHRNEQGHRYYTAYDITLFANIKELKNRGLQLRAIKDVIPRLLQRSPEAEPDRLTLVDGTAAGVEEASQEHSEESGKILEFQLILERLIAQELKMKKDGETRCRNLDAAIRRQQLARREAAAALAEKKKKRKIRS